MEAPARLFGRNAKVLVVRNGWFSYRRSQIFDAGAFTAEIHVIKARQSDNGAQAAFSPPLIDTVVARILADKPDVVFAPHVETSAGVILPDAYISALAAAAHAVGALLG